MRIIVTYPGRFEPFGRHHYTTYLWLVNNFGSENVFITTSNVVNEKSPLSFEEKRAVMMKYGIKPKNICCSDKPYAPKELLERFDPKQDALIVAYGEKDYGRLGFVKKDGTPSYFQRYFGQSDLKPFGDNAYALVAPTVKLNHKGSEICGTYLRSVLSSCTRQEMVELMGWADEGLYKLFRKKFQPDLTPIFEAIVESRITKTQLSRIEQYADALFFRFGIDIEFQDVLSGTHFYNRVNDPRNEPPINADELRQLFKKASQKYGSVLSKENDKAEGILTDMETDINMPFIIKWDKVNRELDLIPKTIMRKKYFSGTDFFRMEDFKTVLEATTFNQGKYTKHIMHPYEDEITLLQFKEFVNDVTKNPDAIEKCTLKCDGYNLEVTVKDGELYCSRNKSTVINPMNFEQLRKKYVDNESALFAFSKAFRAIEDAMWLMNQSNLEDVFQGGKTFLNLEVIHEKNTNIFKYKAPALYLHSIITYDETGNEVYRNTTLPVSLDRIVGKKFGEFTIEHTPKVELKIIEGSQLEELEYIQKKFKITDNIPLNKLPLDALRAIKLFTYKLGNLIIKSNYPASDECSNVNRIIKILGEVAENLKEEDVTSFKASMSALDELGGLQAINPIEGFVLEWRGKIYKLTGTFGALNGAFQIYNKGRFK